MIEPGSAGLGLADEADELQFLRKELEEAREKMRLDAEKMKLDAEKIRLGEEKIRLGEEKMKRDAAEISQLRDLAGLEALQDETAL